MAFFLRADGDGMRAALAVACLAVLAAVALAGCSATPCPAGGTGATQAKTVHVGTNPDGSMYLTPAETRVPHCSKVSFVVVNDDPRTFHDVALLDYDGNDIEHEALGGQTVTTHHKGDLYFVATKKGTFDLLCEVRQPNHADLGMKGKFIVE
jgi:uncharacterized cupredoxin-like copper-binding protein